MKHLSSKHVHYRWNREIDPAMTISPGETVVIETRDTADNQISPGDTVQSIAQVDTDRIHPLTGPLFIEDAEPGDTLAVSIEKITPANWGFNVVPPGKKDFGFMWEKAYEPTLLSMDIDSIKGIAIFSDSIHIPLKPFLGVMGVAPQEKGEFRTFTPGAHGGNMDLAELQEGSELFLPVFVRGALFSAGDMHACQGDGEVTGAGLECAGTAQLTFTLMKQTDDKFPRAETSSHYITLGFHRDITGAAKDALDKMIYFISKTKNITETEAYSLCSIAADLRITQVVNGIVGSHVLMPKNIFKALD